MAPCIELSRTVEITKNLLSVTFPSIVGQKFRESNLFNKKVTKELI